MRAGDIFNIIRSEATKLLPCTVETTGMTQQEAWLWRDLPYPAHTDGEAEVWFSPVQTANQERAKLFHIAGVYQELVALKSSVTGRKYRLKYHLGAKLGAVYLGFTEDEAGNPTKFAVKRLDAVSSHIKLSMHRTTHT